MNPRIYKKRAKRAAEFLRSFGVKTEFTLSTEPGCIETPIPWRRAQWLKKHRPAEYGMWQRLTGIPECFSQGFDGEWDGGSSYEDWERDYYHSDVLPPDFFEGEEWNDGRGKPWPRMNARQRMAMWRYSQIAPGWRWRGGRAVPVAP